MGSDVDYIMPEQKGFGESLREAMEAQGDEELNKKLFSAESNKDWGRPAYARLNQEIINESLYGEKLTHDSEGRIVTGFSGGEGARYQIISAPELSSKRVEEMIQSKGIRSTGRKRHLFNEYELQSNFVIIDNETGEQIKQDGEVQNFSSVDDALAKVKDLGGGALKPIYKKDADGNVIQDKEKAGQVHYAGGGLIETMAGTQEHTFTDAEGNKITRKIGFDENGQPMGLSGVARDLEQVDKAQRFSSEIAFMKDFGDDFTESFRSQGNIQQALDDVATLARDRSAVPQQKLDSGGSAMFDLTQGFRDTSQTKVSGPYGQPQMSAGGSNANQVDPAQNFRNNFNPKETPTGQNPNALSYNEAKVQPAPAGYPGDYIVVQRGEVIDTLQTIEEAEEYASGINSGKYQSPVVRDESEEVAQIDKIGSRQSDGAGQRDMGSQHAFARSYNLPADTYTELPEGYSFEAPADKFYSMDMPKSGHRFAYGPNGERIEVAEQPSATGTRSGANVTKGTEQSEALRNSRDFNYNPFEQKQKEFTKADRLDKATKNLRNIEFFTKKLESGILMGDTPLSEEGRKDLEYEIAKRKEDNERYLADNLFTEEELNEFYNTDDAGRKAMVQKYADLEATETGTQPRTGTTQMQPVQRQATQPQMSGGKLTDERGVDRVGSGREATKVSVQKFYDPVSTDADFGEIESRDADFDPSVNTDFRDVSTSTEVRDVNVDGSIRDVGERGLGDLGGLRSGLVDDALSDLELGGSLSERDRRNAREDARIAMTARGRVRDTAGILAELENNERMREYRKNSRRQYASDVAGREGAFAGQEQELGLRADIANQGADSQMIGYGLDAGRTNQAKDLAEKGMEIDVGKANQAGDLTSNAQEIQLKGIEAGVATSDANRYFSKSQAQAGVNQAEFQANQAGEMFNVTNKTRQQELGLNADLANQNASLTMGARDFGAMQANQNAQMGLTGMAQQADMFNVGQDLTRDKMAIDAGGADLARGIQTDQYNIASEMSGINADRNYAVTRVGLETATASDPLMAVSGRPSGAGTINTQNLYANSANNNQLPTMFNPNVGAQFIADQNSNIIDYNMAYAGAQGVASAGKTAMIGNMVGSIFDYLPVPGKRTT